VPASFAAETIVMPYNDRAALDAVFAANPGQIAGVIIEPYCGNVGFIQPDAGYLSYLREVTARHGSVLIFDEVMTGFRIAKGGVQEREKITPDLTCLGKIIGGGLPVGAFGGRADIMDHLAPLGPVYQAGTRSVVTRSPWQPASRVSGYWKRRIPTSASTRLGRQLRDAVLSAAKLKGLAVQVPQCGSMFSIFFTATPVRDYATALTGDAKLFGRFFHACLEGGVYLAPSAYEAGFLGAAHDGQDLDRACAVMTDALRGL
jgi:glutamate-1-semialdehyde 2,1-aminomutase